MKGQDLKQWEHRFKTKESYEKAISLMEEIIASNLEDIRILQEKKEFDFVNDAKKRLKDNQELLAGFKYEHKT